MHRKQATLMLAFLLAVGAASTSAYGQPSASKLSGALSIKLVGPRNVSGVKATPEKIVVTNGFSVTLKNVLVVIEPGEFIVGASPFTKTHRAGFPYLSGTLTIKRLPGKTAKTIGVKLMVRQNIPPVIALGVGISGTQVSSWKRIPLDG